MRNQKEKKRVSVPCTRHAKFHTEYLLSWTDKIQNIEYLLGCTNKIQNISDRKKLSTVIGKVISQTVMTELDVEWEGGGWGEFPWPHQKISTPYFIIFVVIMYVVFMYVCIYILFYLAIFIK